MPRKKKVQAVSRFWWQRARSAVSGQFVKLIDALRNKSRSVVERVRRREGQNDDEK